ncbi:MAG: hypothetical protein Q9201_003053 [Fulgogasparrea decipioides]
MFAARQVPQSDSSSEGYQTDVTNTSITLAKGGSPSKESKAITPERIAMKGKPPSPLRFVSQIVKQEPAVDNKAGVTATIHPVISRKPVINLPEQLVVASQSNEDKSPTEALVALPSGEERMADPFTVVSTPPSQPRVPPAAYDPAPKLVKVAAVNIRLSSSSSGSQYSTSAHSGQDPTSGSLAIKAPQVAYERQPKALSVNFNRLESVRHEVVDAEPQPRAASLDTRVRPEPCQIFAPVPERSMSSRDSRDRFSRILSIGEDFGKRDLFTNLQPNKKAPTTIQQYLRDKKSHSPKCKIAASKELPPLPDDPPPVPDKGKEKEFIEPRVQDTIGQPHNAQESFQQGNDAYSTFRIEHLAALAGFERPGIPPRYSSISRNSLMDLPGLAQSVRASLLSQKSSIDDQPRRLAITKRNSSLFQSMKELPPLPKDAGMPISKDAIVSIPPPQTPSPLELPCSFIPLMPKEQLDAAVADMADDSKSKIVVTTHISIQQTPPRTVNVGFKSEQPTDSPASARPWNLDTSYPWAGTPPKLEVNIPQASRDSMPETEKLPRFKLRIHRSSVLGYGGKLTKHRPPNLTVVHPPATSTQITPNQTRFTEGLGDGPTESPSTALVPPSPGFNVEAQSFFSDDSSHKQPKGSLRKRLPQIKGMAMRVASSEHVRGLDRGPAGSARGCGWPQERNSKEHPTLSDDQSHPKTGRRKLLDKVKSWFHHYQSKVRQWRGRARTRIR